ncbi:hypothetical protein RUM43_006739 [Polyplax serrata]|uniref:Uncharacterized protein n=1 Tax=Polyplax serrata TaxID=468196 RepID=A0AAN8PL03_POLSC
MLRGEKRQVKPADVNSLDSFTNVRGERRWRKKKNKKKKKIGKNDRNGMTMDLLSNRLFNCCGTIVRRFQVLDLKSEVPGITQLPPSLERYLVFL